MYTYHRVLARYGQLVEYYIIDARPLPSGRPLIQLTVLTAPCTPEIINIHIWLRLSECMCQDELHTLANDLGCEHDWLRTCSFSVLVKNYGEAMP